MSNDTTEIRFQHRKRQAVLCHTLPKHRPISECDKYQTDSLRTSRWETVCERQHSVSRGFSC